MQIYIDLLPAHIQSSTDVQPLPSSSQTPVAIECTQSEGLDIQVSSGTVLHDPNSVSTYLTDHKKWGARH